jgi:hypothetical protein
VIPSLNQQGIETRPGLSCQALIEQFADCFELAGERLWRCLSSTRTEPGSGVLQIDNGVACFLLVFAQDDKFREGTPWCRTFSDNPK